MPFDRFTVEQLAGDLLPNRSVDQQIASGFNRCNITSNEGGLIPEEYLVLYTRDRTETTSQVWLGMTAGCAVCHDHKFDPLSQKEFYSLSAFFNNTTQPAMDGNIKDTPPNIVVPLAKDRARWDTLLNETKAAQERIDHRREGGHPDFNIWLAGVSSEIFSSRVVKDQPLFHALLADDKAPAIRVDVHGQVRENTLATNAAWQEGVLAAKAYVSSAKPAPQIADAGDLEKDKAFSYSAWVYLAKGKDGAVFARMADAGGKYRGWDLIIEGGKPASHLVHD